MRHPRTTATMIAIAIAASAGGLAGAATTGNAAPKASARAADGATSMATLVGRHVIAPPTLHTTSASVGGRIETILVNAKGLPLYYYKGDTAKKSMVTGELAGLWPALVAKSPTGKGVVGKVTVAATSNGSQVAYKGHFLYTFVEDSAGRVTGQGVSDFFVVTPGIAAQRVTSSTTSAAGSAASAPAGSTGGYSSSNNYGY
jgi:predicted lipoprotein with Yx(FWY)xxD motif